MISFFVPLFGWMPPVLSAISSGVIAILIIVVILRLISFILDLIPFL